MTASGINAAVAAEISRDLALISWFVMFCLRFIVSALAEGSLAIYIDCIFFKFFVVCADTLVERG
jgi:hypothetical protein